MWMVTKKHFDPTWDTLRYDDDDKPTWRYDVEYDIWKTYTQDYSVQAHKPTVGRNFEKLMFRTVKIKFTGDSK